MNDKAWHLHEDEDILAHTASDEALEAAAEAQRTGGAAPLCLVRVPCSFIAAEANEQGAPLDMTG
jgi:hypothetical protein